MKVIQNKWFDNFFNELNGTRELRIISPFNVGKNISKKNATLDGFSKMTLEKEVR